MFQLFKQIWRDNVFGNVFGGIILLAITSIASKIFTDSYITLLVRYWYLLAIIILIILLAVNLKKNNKAAYSSEIIPLRGWKELYEYKYYYVLWIVRKPNDDLLDLYLMEQTNPEDLDIVYSPRCPNCRTELKEKKILFRRYKWFCIKCEFKVKNNLSFTEASNNVKKIIQSDYRNYLLKKENKI
jgi:hypothetical protein